MTQLKCPKHETLSLENTQVTYIPNVSIDS